VRRRYPGWARGLSIVLLAVLLVGLTLANYQFAQRAPGGNDFLTRWVGANAWVREGIDPYDPRVSLRAQEMIYGRPADPVSGEDVANFVYPLPAMVFFAPFGLLPYPLARALWMTLLEIALPVLALIGVRLGRWNPSPGVLGALMLFSVLWYHGFRAVIVGQFAVIEAVLMAGALLAISREQDILAGFLLALTVAKPQMAFLLAPFVILWAASRRRWWVVISSAGFLAVLLGVTLLLIPDWPILWLRQLADYPEYTALGSPISIIASAVPPGRVWIDRILTGLLILYLLWEWSQATGKGERAFLWAAQLTIVITNLVAFRTATTNFVAMLPALCLILATFGERWGRRSHIPVLLTLAGLLAGLWALFLSTVEGNVESAAMYLPAPLLLLVGLWWVRWWARREPLLHAASL
jgi:hypothetical protein